MSLTVKPPISLPDMSEAGKLFGHERVAKLPHDRWRIDCIALARQLREKYPDLSPDRAFKDARSMLRKSGVRYRGARTRNGRKKRDTKDGGARSTVKTS